MCTFLSICVTIMYVLWSEEAGIPVCKGGGGDPHKSEGLAELGVLIARAPPWPT